MRKFEKVSFEEFKKDFGDNKVLYDSISLPKRSTMNSAGYDFKSLENFVLKSHTSHVFKTGIKAIMNKTEVLYIYDRSSFGFKYDIMLSNSVGVIDSDFYNNPENEGNIGIKLINLGENDIEIHIGDRIAQGVFMKFLTVSNEEQIDNKRTGGVGSTGKGE